MKKLTENQTLRFIKHLRTNNRLEFFGEDFDSICKENGITHHKTVRYTPQQNSVVERLDRTIIKRVRCLLLDANLTERF